MSARTRLLADKHRGPKDAVVALPKIDTSRPVLSRLSEIHRERNKPVCSTCRCGSALTLLHEIIDAAAKAPGDFRHIGLPDIVALLKRETDWNATDRALNKHLHDHEPEYLRKWQDARAL